mmetsp:Transcript_26083/g.62064  ORF Transcript_26083/g.62064 Transcript_26083/m.62064 type:complete len:96 (+) Transcript_26083:581-868(+)
MDTAASAFGIWLGRTPIHPSSQKTVEGLCGGVASTLAFWWVLESCGALGTLPATQGVFCVAAATLGSGILEVCTAQLDNLFLPASYLAMLSLLLP